MFFIPVLGTELKRMCEVDLPQRACNTEQAGYVKVVLDSPRGGLYSLAGTLKASRREFCH